jgi:ectoine hydroxylase-related dioxygenase (phytanoyl-CoA dioxygenase family)
MSASSSSSVTSVSSSSLLTAAHIEKFKRDGFCVVENVVDTEGVAQLRRDLHRFVRDRIGFNPSKLDRHAVKAMKESDWVSQGLKKILELFADLIVFQRMSQCVLFAVEVECILQ